jgi:hypothetical protein
MTKSSIVFFVAYFAFSSIEVFAGQAGDARRMGPGVASEPVGVSVQKSKLLSTGPLAMPAATVAVPAPKASAMPHDRRLNIVGEGRLLGDSSLPNFDVADVEWTKQDSKYVSAIRVMAPGAAQLRVGLRFAGRGNVGIRVAGSSGAPRSVSAAAIEAASDNRLLWTPITDGDAQVVELTMLDVHDAANIQIVGVSYIDHPVNTAESGDEKALPVGTSLACQVNVACVDAISGLDSTIKTAFDNKVNATALLVITKDTGVTVSCTGTLLNNDYKAPEFLTAYHCIGSASEANSAITVWNFQANDCGGSSHNAGDPRLNGAVWLGGNEDLDLTLIGLRDLPPSTAILSGWDAGGYYAAGNLMLGMHHPRGDLKKTSIGTIIGLQTTPFSIEGVTHGAYEFYNTQWQIGLVEPGSSGSGLFVQPAGKDYLALIGTLFSGPATLSCSASTTYINTFSRLDLFYPSVNRFFKSDYSTNYTDLWWNPAESGWGVNIQHQGNTLFATWFTYDSTGAGMWLVMSDAEKQPDGSYSGAIYQTTGTPFNLINGAAAVATISQVGIGSFAFSGANTGVFSYTVNGISGAKAIQRQEFSTPASCSFTLSSRASLTNYQDLWSNPSEPGWGLNIAHQGNIIFATWFTYDTNGHGMWLVMSDGEPIAPRTYQGALYRTTGTPFNQINGTSAIKLPLQQVGTLTLQFQDGTTGTMSYQVNGFSGNKPIERQLFALPDTRCQ